MTITRNIADDLVPSRVSKNDLTSKTACKYMNCRPAQEYVDSLSHLFSPRLREVLKKRIIEVEKAIGIGCYIPPQHACGVAFYTLPMNRYPQDLVARVLNIRIDTLRRYIKKFRSSEHYHALSYYTDLHNTHQPFPEALKDALLHYQAIQKYSLGVAIYCLNCSHSIHSHSLLHQENFDFPQYNCILCDEDECECTDFIPSLRFDLFTQPHKPKIDFNLLCQAKLVPNNLFPLCYKLFIPMESKKGAEYHSKFTYAVNIPQRVINILFKHRKHALPPFVLEVLRWTSLESIERASYLSSSPKDPTPTSKRQSDVRILHQVSDSQIENREFKQNQDTENRKLNHTITIK